MVKRAHWREEKRRKEKNLQLIEESPEGFVGSQRPRTFAAENGFSSPSSTNRKILNQENRESKSGKKVESFDLTHKKKNTKSE